MQTLSIPFQGVHFDCFSTSGLGLRQDQGLPSTQEKFKECKKEISRNDDLLSSRDMEWNVMTKGLPF
jgi:hypothetical protein